MGRLATGSLRLNRTKPFRDKGWLGGTTLRKRFRFITLIAAVAIAFVAVRSAQPALALRSAIVNLPGVIQIRGTGTALLACSVNQTVINLARPNDGTAILTCTNNSGNSVTLNVSASISPTSGAPGVSWSPTTLTVTSGSSASTTLTVNSKNNNTPRTYTYTFTVADTPGTGNVDYSKTFTITINLT